MSIGITERITATEARALDWAITVKTRRATLKPMANGSRCVVIFTIGLDSPGWHEFENLVIQEACRLEGGCTVSRNIGYWIDGAEYPDTRYTGPIDEEYCFRVEVMGGRLDLDPIVRGMRSCIRQEARRLEVPIEWVQVTAHEVNSYNFSVKGNHL